MTHTTIEKEDKTMNENEREFFTLVDEDGSEIEFEKIGEITLNEKVYFAMIPAEAADNAQNDGGFCEYVVLRLEKDENGAMRLLRIEEAIAGFENRYLDRVSEETYNAMKTALDRIKSRVGK
jgi:uncharacterized protein YrzB (UPF0473 family)